MLKKSNDFVAYFEKNWSQNCPSYVNFHYYRRYVNDFFVLFTSPEHLEDFWNFLNGWHANMAFTIENEKQNRISFLEIQIIREDKKFTTSVYQKAIFSGVYTHYDSCLRSTYKFGTVYTLAYRSFRVCSSWSELHTKLVCLKELHLKKWLPWKFSN